MNTLKTSTTTPPPAPPPNNSNNRPDEDPPEFLKDFRPVIAAAVAELVRPEKPAKVAEEFLFIQDDGHNTISACASSFKAMKAALVPELGWCAAVRDEDRDGTLTDEEVREVVRTGRVVRIEGDRDVLKMIREMIREAHGLGDYEFPIRATRSRPTEQEIQWAEQMRLEKTDEAEGHPAYDQPHTTAWVWEKDGTAVAKGHSLNDARIGANQRLKVPIGIVPPGMAIRIDAESPDALMETLRSRFGDAFARDAEFTVYGNEEHMPPEMARRFYAGMVTVGASVMPRLGTEDQVVDLVRRLFRARAESKRFDRDAVVGEWAAANPVPAEGVRA